MKVGVFTALLSQMSLDDVLKKLKSVGVSTVELGTGNYPGDLRQLAFGQLICCSFAKISRAARDGEL